MNRNLYVFYDSRCPLCAREIIFYKRRYPHADIRWIDLHTVVRSDDLPATRAEMLKVIHAMDAEGTILKGVDAFAAMWKKLSIFWALAAKVITLPIFRQVAEVTYASFAKRRYSKLYCET